MADIIGESVAAHIDCDFVAFLIGLRINKPWKIHKWLPAALAMPRMLKELSVLPSDETGFLGYSSATTGVMVQYWRSYDHLEKYARSQDHTHFSTWNAFNKRIKGARADVGIWHETYLIKDGQYEAVYSGMPAFGLGKASSLVPATDKRSVSRSRLER